MHNACFTSGADSDGTAHAQDATRVPEESEVGAHRREAGSASATESEGATPGQDAHATSVADAKVDEHEAAPGDDA